MRRRASLIIVAVLTATAIGLLLVGCSNKLARVDEPVARSSTALLSGVVAAYGFEEGSGTTAADATSNHFNGTLAGPTWTTNGRFGKALQFDGQNDWMTVPNATALRLTQMTLSAWVFPTAPLPMWLTVILKEGTNNLEYALYAHTDVNNLPGAYFIGGGFTRDIFGTSPVPVNAWTHLTATYDGTKNLAARALAHALQKGIQIRPIPGLSNIARAEARAIEQVLIERYGLGKSGGTLLNMIK